MSHIRRGDLNSDLGLDATYERLENCLGLVRCELGETQYRRLIVMAGQSEHELRDNDLKAGLFLLQDMRKSMRKRS